MKNKSIYCNLDETTFIKIISPSYFQDNVQTIMELVFYKEIYEIEKKNDLKITIKEYENWNVYDPNMY